MKIGPCCRVTMLVLLVIVHGVSHASESLSYKGKLTYVNGFGVDGIYRAEGWVVQRAAHLDLKIKLEEKDGQGLIKARLQYLPIPIGMHELGLALRYQQKEDDAGVSALGLAVRFNGEQWKWPIRYYPAISQIHSKPVLRHGRIRSDCQIIYDHDEDNGSLRPGVDWLLTQNFSVGIEGRAYTDSDKNYLGLRLSLLGGF